jgi:hypothetical protein
MSAATASYVRILNGYFTRPDYFTADVEKGTIRTPTGVRTCALTDDFLLGFRSALVFECGKASDRVFKSCGRKWGVSFVERFDRELGEYYGVPVRDLSAGIVEKCLDDAFRAHGWGQLAVDYGEYDNGLIQVTIHDSVLPAIFGTGDKPSDALMAGFLAAVFSFYANTDLDCQQTDCPSRGADASRFVIGLAGRLTDVPKWTKDKLAHATVVRRLVAARPEKTS